MVFHLQHFLILTILGGVKLKSFSGEIENVNSDKMLPLMLFINNSTSKKGLKESCCVGNVMARAGEGPAGPWSLDRWMLAWHGHQRPLLGSGVLWCPAWAQIQRTRVWYGAGDVYIDQLNITHDTGCDQIEHTLDSIDNDGEYDGSKLGDDHLGTTSIPGCELQVRHHCYIRCPVWTSSRMTMTAYIQDWTWETDRL